MISESLRTQIKGYLEGFIQGIVDEARQTGFDPKELRPIRTYSEEGELKPFHESLLPDGILRTNEFERSFSTKLGTTFEECAVLVAGSVHKSAKRGYRVSGAVTPAAVRRIEEIVDEISSRRIGNYLEYVREIVKLSKGTSSIERKNIADLRIETLQGIEWYFELKSPKPNKGQCLEATFRLLQIHALTQEKYPNVRTFYSMAYNPYGLSKKEYKHSFVLNYMDVEKEVLIGKEFWDLIGGENTYEEILAIYQEVGKEKGPDMIDQLALGY